MDTKEEDELLWAKSEMEMLLRNARSCMLATVSSGGQPLSSYAPVLVDERRRFFVYVSAMAKHYAHLKRSGLASLSLIEDESAAAELFARKRLTVDCAVRLVERDSSEWKRSIERMVERHGSTMGYLRELVDFDLFELTASEGRLVLGFGKAYRIFGDGLSDVSYLGSGGHRSKS